MTTRVFRTADRVRADGGNIGVIHDPCSGLTHVCAPGCWPDGRTRIDPALVEEMPTIHPRDLLQAIPVSVCWSPIVACNLQCPHCLDDKRVRGLGKAERRVIAERIGASGVLGVDISGGEPLLLRDLTSLAEVLVSNGCVVSVTTNGWYLQARAAELAARIDGIRVSLDGPSPPFHDRWRGPGSFERALSGVRAAIDVGLPVQIQTVIMRSTAATAQDMVDLANAAGARGVSFLQMLPFGEGERMASDEMLMDDEAESLVMSLDRPHGLEVRVRRRDSANGFTVVRADGALWVTGDGATRISQRRPLESPRDMMLVGPDGSA
jgi:MoaA/NifB/PqqE/SkfB family radical SAM enzyme